MLKQPVEFQMNIDENKKMWDTNVDSPADLLRYEIITGRDSSFRKSFESTQHMNKTIKWTIDGDQYDKNHEYKVTIRHVFNASQPGKVHRYIEDTCESKPENDLATNYTKKWSCLFSKASSTEFIDIDNVCNGILECNDLSDEGYRVCKPPDDLFQNLAIAIVSFVLVAGSLTFLVVHCTSRNNKSMSDFLTEDATIIATKNLVSICQTSIETNKKETKGLTETNTRIVQETYQSCVKGNNSKQVLKVLFALSHIRRFSTICFRVFDAMLLKEKQTHQSTSNAIRCLKVYHGDESYISNYVKTISQRHKCTSRIKSFLSNLLRCPCKTINLYFQILLQWLLAIAKLMMFYYDILKDLIGICLIKQVDTTLFDAMEKEERFDSVGGINFKVIYYYLISILVTSEFLRIFYMHKCEEKFAEAFHINSDKKIATIMIKLFPIHFLLYTKAAVDCKVLREIHTLDNLMHDIDDKSMDNEKAKWIMKITDNLDILYKQSFHLNQMECNIQIIETLSEREPQSVVTFSLLMLMQKFSRIRILFDSFFGIPFEIILIVTSAITILAMVRSIMRVIHVRRYPIGPGFCGSILQFLAILVIVLAKITLISVSLLNAMYFHIFLHGFNVLMAYVYCKFQYKSTPDLFDHMVIISTIPTFYSPPKPKTRSLEAEISAETTKRFKFCEKIISPIFLYLMTFAIYWIIGSILRVTTFFYNIKIDDYGYKKMDKLVNTSIAAMNGNKYWENESLFGENSFKEYIYEFPSLIIFGVYVLAVGVHIILSVLYYRLGHPWKFIIWEK